MRTVVSGLLLILSLGALAPVTASRAVAATDSSLTVRLEGPWRFAIGDDETWADPDFDDSAWETRTVPTEGGQEDFDSQNTRAWFRRTFPLPADAAGVDLFLALGVVDDADEVYVNGELVAGSGVIGDEPVTAFFWPRLYDVDEAPFVLGAPNTIAVRVNDTGGGGGISAGPVALLSRDRVAAEVFGEEFHDGGAAVALATLERQERAIAAGDVDGYVATLSSDHFHQGHDRVRQRARVERLLATHGSVTRSDAVVRSGVAPDGALVVEVRRTWTDGAGAEVPEARGSVHAPLTGADRTLEFLRFDPTTGLELGDRARFFRDVVVSEVSDAYREMDVYLPPGYLTDPDRRYPSVYLFHGAGGNNKEWEGKDLDGRLDELIGRGLIPEMIVVAVDGKSPAGVNTWYANSSEEQWRTMFYDELLPQIDTTFRTIDDRRFRGTTGWSMGGQGAFTIAWDAPELFGSIVSLSGALSFPPIAGGPTDLALNARLDPLVMVNTLDPLTVGSYCYHLYAGEDDDFAFDDAARAMQVELASRAVLVTAEIKPSPAVHADHVQLPGLAPSFRLHGGAFGTQTDSSCAHRVPANEAPVLGDDTVTMEAGALEPDGSVELDVLANDTDEGGDRLRFTALSAPAAGTVVDTGRGTLRYTPSDPAAPAADTFTYEVTDGRGIFVSASVTLTVAGAPPTGPTAPPATTPPTLPATGGGAAGLAAGAALVALVLAERGIRTRTGRSSDG